MSTKLSISDNFPFPSIETFDTKLSYPLLKTFQDKLLQNVASVPSPLGGANHGHSGLLLPDAEYHRETGHHFVRPVFPGAVPLIPFGTAALAERNIRADHLAALQRFQTANAVENAIRKIINHAIPEDFLEPLKQPITGLSNVGIDTIMVYLFRTNGKLSSHDLEEARKVAKESWDPTTPVQVMLNRIKR